MATTINALAIRKRLGKAEWSPPYAYGPDGWCWGSEDMTKAIIASAHVADGVEWIHASLGYRDETTVPTLDDLNLLHRAVFDSHYAYQAISPKHESVNRSEIHLWARADGKSALPVGL